MLILMTGTTKSHTILDLITERWINVPMDKVMGLKAFGSTADSTPIIVSGINRIPPAPVFARVPLLIGIILSSRIVTAFLGTILYGKMPILRVKWCAAVMTCKLCPGATILGLQFAGARARATMFAPAKAFRKLLATKCARTNFAGFTSVTTRIVSNECFTAIFANTFTRYPFWWARLYHKRSIPRYGILYNFQRWVDVSGGTPERIESA